MMDVTRRAFATGMLGSFAAPVASQPLRCALISGGLVSAGCTPTDFIRVDALRERSDSDDTQAFSRAFATGRPVYVAAGKGSAPDGAYLVDTVELPGGAVLFGDGPVSVIRTARPESYCCFRADSGDAARWLDDIVIRSLQLEGSVAAHGFSEGRHLVRLHGVRNARIEAVVFRAWRGDALYLGSGDVAGQERHNRNVTVRGCIFDGVNNDNRNAISLIDIDGVVIEHCAFRRCTRPNMPGPIDFEPDENSFAIIRNIRVSDNLFVGNGGNLGEIGMHIPAKVMALPKNIVIERNRFRDYRGSGATIGIDINKELSDPSAGMRVIIRDNRGERGHLVYRLLAVQGVRAHGNEWRDYSAGSYLGYWDETDVTRNVSIADMFNRCADGRSNRVALLVFRTYSLSLNKSHFIDCGDGKPGSNAIEFVGGGAVGLEISGVTIASPTGRTVKAIVRREGYRLSQVGAFEDNRLNGLPSDIPVS